MGGGYRSFLLPFLILRPSLTFATAVSHLRQALLAGRKGGSSAPRAPRYFHILVSCDWTNENGRAAHHPLTFTSTFCHRSRPSRFIDTREASTKQGAESWPVRCHDSHALLLAEYTTLETPGPSGFVRQLSSAEQLSSPYLRRAGLLLSHRHVISIAAGDGYFLWR